MNNLTDIEFSTSSGDTTLPPAPATTQIGTPISGDYRIDVLLESASERWNNGSALGTPVQVTYSFMTAKPTYGGTDDNQGDTGFSPFTAAQKQAVKDIFAKLSSELNISFVEVADTSASYGQIRFGDNSQASSAGYAYLPNSTGSDLSGDVWIDLKSADQQTPGTYNYATLVHEIGHALGLKHPGNYNAGETSVADPAGNYLSAAEDNTDYTIMSYRDPANADGQQRIWYGMYDMLALRYLYGGRSDIALGNTSYAFGDSVGTQKVLVEDSGGTDTLDFSGLTTSAAKINLQEGAFSSAGVSVNGIATSNNISIMYGTVIENAIGSAGADTITGNSANNVITGGGGNDTIDGGAGTDTAVYSLQRSNYAIMKKASGVYTITAKTGTEGTDQLSNVEKFQFSDSTVSTDYSDMVQSLYVAYFGRAADALGASNFQTQLANLGAPHDLQGLSAAYSSNSTVRALIDAFGTSAESQALYTGDTKSFVTAVYNNVLNRGPDQAGLDFWANAIDHGGLSRGNASLSIMAGAQSNTSTQGLIDGALVTKKIAVASNFTLALNTTNDVIGYAGDHAAGVVRQMLSSVTSATDTDAFESTVISTVASLSSQVQYAAAAASPQADALQIVGVPDAMHALV